MKNMIKYDTASKVGKIRDAVNNLILSEFNKHGVDGIAPSHGDILVCLYEKNGLSVKELAEKIHRTQPTVTVLIDKLMEPLPFQILRQPALQFGLLMNG
jgi:hypothetical protein